MSAVQTGVIIMDTELKLQFVNTFSTLMTAAFGMVAALAWNTAIKALIDQYITAGNELLGYFVYAVIVTVIAVVAIMAISRSLKKLADKVAEKDAAKKTE